MSKKLSFSDPVNFAQLQACLAQLGLVREDGTRCDANESMYVAKQLEHVTSEVTRTEHTPLLSASFVPYVWDIPEGAQTWTYRHWTDVAPPRAKVIHDYANDFGDVSMFVEEKSFKLVSYGQGYGYSVDDLRAAAFAKVPLDSELGRICRDTIARSIDDFAAFGDPDTGVTGFINNSAIPSVAPAVGTWDSSTTPADLIKDLNKLALAVKLQSKGLYDVDTLALPLSVMTLLVQPYSELNGKSVLATWLESQTRIKNVDFWHLLDTNAGVTAEGTSKALAIAYRRDPSVVKMRGRTPFEQFPAQLKGMKYFIPARCSVGGVVVFLPLAMAKMDLLASP
jgi:hypothetical protein